MACQPDAEELLLLDPGDLLEGLEVSASRVDLNIPLTVNNVPSGEDGVRAIPAGAGVDTRALYTEPGLLMRIILFIFAILKKLLYAFLGIFGIQKATPVEVTERYQMSGLRPVILNGLPLLMLNDPHQSSLNLPLKAGEQRSLCNFGLVAGNRGEGGLYHIQEEVDGHVVGGVSIQVNP